MGLLFHLGVLVGVVVAFAATRDAMPIDASLALCTGLVVLLSIFGELMLGRREPAVSRADAARDLAYTLITAATAGTLSTAFGVLAVHVAAWRSEAIGWPTSWPFFAQALAAVLLSDFASYWIHRLVHRFDLLYRFHEVHHSSTALHWLNANRFHPIDTLFFQLATTAPIVLIGAPEEVVALTALLSQAGALLQHTRVPVDGGLVNRILHTSLAHRLHHREAPCPVRNFGGTLLLWDWLFGTHEAPNLDAPRLGTGRAQPTGLWKQLIEPLRSRSEK